MLYVVVLYREYSKKADFVTEIGFLLKHIGESAKIVFVSYLEQVFHHDFTTILSAKIKKMISLAFYP